MPGEPTLGRGHVALDVLFGQRGEHRLASSRGFEQEFLARKWGGGWHGSYWKAESRADPAFGTAIRRSGGQRQDKISVLVLHFLSRQRGGRLYRIAQHAQLPSNEPILPESEEKSKLSN